MEISRSSIILPLSLLPKHQTPYWFFCRLRRLLEMHSLLKKWAASTRAGAADRAFWRLAMLAQRHTHEHTSYWPVLGFTLTVIHISVAFMYFHSFAAFLECNEGMRIHLNIIQVHLFIVLTCSVSRFNHVWLNRLLYFENRIYLEKRLCCATKQQLARV